VIRVDRQALVPYTAEQMFALVDDIEAYPTYLSSCKSATILSRNADILEAELCLAKSGIEQRFSTRNTNKKFEHIQIQLLHGPFGELQGDWSFTEVEGLGCKIEFHLAFEMKRSLLNKLISGLVVEASNKLVDAICQRANEIYAIKVDSIANTTDLEIKN
jgi:ribosome-associated toxin RatA of RatAB toxin-antitoxin module